MMQTVSSSFAVLFGVIGSLVAPSVHGCARFRSHRMVLLWIVILCGFTGGCGGAGSGSASHIEFWVSPQGNDASPGTREGLTFSYATWLGPSGDNGYVADQSGNHLVGEGHQPNIIGHDPNVVRTPGNVRFRFAREIEFRGNIFEHLGGVGLDFDTGSQGNRIVDNLFEDVSAAAIQLGGVSPVDHHPDHPEQVTPDNVISNNLIRQVGREYVDAAGIFVGFTRRTLISHNTIVDVPWAGIAMGWGWGLLDPGSFPGLPNAQSGEWGTYDKPTPNSENRILNNLIHGFPQRPLGRRRHLHNRPAGNLVGSKVC